MTAETTETPLEPWHRIRELIDDQNGPALQALMAGLEPAETVRILFRLDADDRRSLIGLLAPDDAADILEDLPDAPAADLIEGLSADKAADIVEALSSDHGADILAELDDHDARAILDRMLPEMAQPVRELIAYPGDVAGGLMGPEHYAYPRTARVEDFLEDLDVKRRTVEQLPQRLILLDRLRRPVGAVDIADVLLTEPETPLSQLARPVKPVPVLAGLDELEAYFDRYETLGAPVVDLEGRLVGRIRRRALFDALAERAQEDHLKVQGIVGGEELRSMPLLIRSRRRLSWLSVNILLNILAASVIALFQDTLSAVIALAVFLPIVSDMSGCSGNQAIAVSMRELTLGIVEPRDVLRVWLQEVSVGIMNGVALGCLLSITAVLWQGSPWLGLVVGAALAINTVVAVSIGGTVPLLLKRLRVDPAIASGPMLTTVTDMCGFFLVLGFATVALPWLV
jgi:magnesium transporter